MVAMTDDSSGYAYSTARDIQNMDLLNMAGIAIGKAKDSVNPVSIEPGKYDVVNQMSGFYSIRQLAEAVAKIASKEFNIPVTIQRVENPRVEYDIHPYEPIYNKLPDQFGFEPKVQLEDEIYRMLKLLTQPEIKQRIEEKKHLILPRTWWSGEKKLVESLEIIEEIKYEVGS